MHDFLLDVLVDASVLGPNDPAMQVLARDHGTEHKRLINVTRSEFCARYHTCAGADCVSIVPCLEHLAWFFYGTIAPSKPFWWQKHYDDAEEARELFRWRIEEVFEEIESERLQRHASRLADLLIKHPDHSFRSLGKANAIDILTKPLTGNVYIAPAEGGQWLEILRDYAGELTLGQQWDPSHLRRLLTASRRFCRSSKMR